MAEKLCKQIGHSYEFEFPKYEDLIRVLIMSFPENVARLRNRGTRMYETLRGKTIRLTRHSLLRKADWVFGMRILEKTIKGSVGLEMTWVTPLSLPLVEDCFEHEISQEEKVVLDLDTRKVVKGESLIVWEFCFLISQNRIKLQQLREQRLMQTRLIPET